MAVRDIINISRVGIKNNSRKWNKIKISTKLINDPIPKGNRRRRENFKSEPGTKKTKLSLL
jgi:hypothetical protein